MALQAVLVCSLEAGPDHQSRPRAISRQAHERDDGRTGRRPSVAGLAPQGGRGFDFGRRGPEMTIAPAKARPGAYVVSLFRDGPLNSGLPEFSDINVQVGNSRLGWTRPQMRNCASGNLEIPRCAIAHLR